MPTDHNSKVSIEPSTSRQREQLTNQSWIQTSSKHYKKEMQMSSCAFLALSLTYLDCTQERIPALYMYTADSTTVLRIWVDKIEYTLRTNSKRGRQKGRKRCGFYTIPWNTLPSTWSLTHSDFNRAVGYSFLVHVIFIACISEQGLTSLFFISWRRCWVVLLWRAVRHWNTKKKKLEEVCKVWVPSSPTA